MKKTVSAIIIMSAVNAMAGLITFDLKDDAAVYSLLDNQASASVTNNGLAVTLTASDGVMNRTSLGFGINGPGTDDTDALNAGQYIDLVFGQDVTFTELGISSWGSGDAGEVRYGDSLGLFESIAGSGTTTYDFNVSAGETIRIAATADSGASNGFSVDRITVAVPEPAVLSLIGLGGGALYLARRKRQ